MPTAPRSRSWLVGLLGALALVAGTRSAAPARAAVPPTLTAVSCASASLCVAVGDNAVVVSTNPTGGRTAWKVVPLAGASGQLQLDAVSCSQGFCSAGGNGVVAVSADPAGGAGAWRVTKIPAYNGVRGVSCPSPSLCVAVDGEANAVTSIDPRGGSSAWKLTPAIGSGGFNGVSCPSVSLCVAVGDGFVSSARAPTAGRAAWTENETGPNFLAVSCPSSALCVAAGIGYVGPGSDPNGQGGALFTTRDPASGDWAGAPPARRAYVAAVSCPTVSFCAVVGDNLTLYWSTDPTGGAGSWQHASIPASTGGYFRAVSCVSRSLCVAVPNYGAELDVSTNPTGGASSWRVVHLQSGTGGCVVPRVVGLRLGAAVRALDAVRCGVPRIVRRRSGPGRKGRVIAQIPPAGTRLDGATVVLVVGA